MTDQDRRIQALEAAIHAMWSRGEISDDMAIHTLKAAKFDAADAIFRRWSAHKASAEIAC